VYPVTIDSIRDEQVKTALRTVEDLRWLATRDDAVAALRNMKTLAWVVQASSQFQADSTDLTSLPALVDRIWKFWTDRQFAYQGLLMRLGEREAEFARSFALSELEATDQQLLDRKPTHLPIREVGRNRIGFEHDLAADWARFQRLTEVADYIGRWAPLAGKPLWGGALRLLGQLLLRQTSDEGNAWQRALSAVEARGEQLAADVLLDALCLDPQASKFLDQHAELLFANHGQLLIRLTTIAGRRRPAARRSSSRTTRAPLIEVSTKRADQPQPNGLTQVQVGREAPPFILSAARIAFPFVALDSRRVMHPPSACFSALMTISTAIVDRAPVGAGAMGTTEPRRLDAVALSRSDLTAWRRDRRSARATAPPSTNVVGRRSRTN
jgi:hypothetical protein